MTEDLQALKERATDAETLEHIQHVRNFLGFAIANLLRRAADHDSTKLRDPERAVFTEYTPKLRGSTYGSPEYFQMLNEMKPALDHHYKHNRHHPEHFEHGIEGMNLIDLLEMLLDWKAATMRHANGDLQRSILKNQERFRYDDQLRTILENTARDMGLF